MDNSGFDGESDSALDDSSLVPIETTVDSVVEKRSGRGAGSTRRTRTTHPRSSRPKTRQSTTRKRATPKRRPRPPRRPAGPKRRPSTKSTKRSPKSPRQGKKAPPKPSVRRILIH